MSFITQVRNTSNWILLEIDDGQQVIGLGRGGLAAGQMIAGDCR